jgi:hypothetical protein
MVMNKLLATFTLLHNLDSVVQNLVLKHTINYNKIFVLNLDSSEELMVTYNIPSTELKIMPDNTILLHRKKESNTLYSINALNEIIKKLNGGVVDSKFQIDWQHYRNSVLLTDKNELNILKTRLYKIIDVNE